MSGACGLALFIIYLMVDINHKFQKVLKSIFRPLEYMGMNAILVYFWHGTAEAILHSVYFTSSVDPQDPSDKRKTIITFIHDQIIGGIFSDAATI